MNDAKLFKIMIVSQMYIPVLVLLRYGTTVYQINAVSETPPYTPFVSLSYTVDESSKIQPVDR